ncbi:hypothetical protein HWV62_26007 [Athelia sp. TMB]|nr:hypothetical protein HWV62_26007 [Athelia sp. TMB]
MPGSGQDKENDNPLVGSKRAGDDTLVFPAKKLMNMKVDPVVHVGRHFGRTVSAVVNIKTLVSNGISRQLRLHTKEISFDDLEPHVQREHKIFAALLEAIPNLLDRMDESQEAHYHLCEMIQKGINNTCSDDTKGLKGAVID